MQFLVVLLPLALLVDLGWLVRYLRDRRLVRYLRARHPAVLEELRGRPRRWYDTSDEFHLQERAVRAALRKRLAPILSADPELAAAVADVEAGERFLRRAAWLGAALSLGLVVLFWVRFSD